MTLSDVIKNRIVYGKEAILTGPVKIEGTKTTALINYLGTQTILTPDVNSWVNSIRILSSSDATPNEMLFWVNNGVRMNIDSAGNVGVGTANPTQKLDVNGNIKGNIGYFTDAILTDDLTVSGDILANGAGAIGYTTGSGGSVVQATSRTTSVTINKTNGSIEMFSGTPSTTWNGFTVLNNKVDASDTIIVNQKSGTHSYLTNVVNVANGAFIIAFASTVNVGAADQPVFNFSVIKASAS